MGCAIFVDLFKSQLPMTDLLTVCVLTLFSFTAD